MTEALLQLLTIENTAALVTLTVMEIVLGIDNLVFIAILADKLPQAQRGRARKVGLMLAMFVRIALLFTIGWLMGLTNPWITLAGYEITGRDLVLIAGGGFLVYKAVHEIHDKMEGSRQTLHQPEASARFSGVLTQIIIMDIIFSLDSVITAVGMVKPGGGTGHGGAAAVAQTAEAASSAAAIAPDRPLWVAMTIMIVAIMVSIGVMIAFAGPISNFIAKHPTTKMLALAFLMLIGVVLVAEGLGAHIDRGYIYAAMGFSILVELLNQRTSAKKRVPASPAP